MILASGVLLVFIWCLFLVWINAELEVKPRITESHTFQKSQVTFLIAARNEAKNISDCLEAISKEFETEIARIVFVDDHSDDDTVKIARQAANQFSNLEVVFLENVGQGKKAALKTGLQAIKSELIYLMDADCILQEGSVNEMLIAISQKDVAAAQGMVFYSGNNLWSSALQVENLNNMSVTESMLNRSFSGFGNAGNFLFKSEFLNGFEASLNSDFASGDDVFFIQWLFDQNLKVRYVTESKVKTEPPQNLTELVNQRVRWASKSSGIKTGISRFLPAFVFGIHLLLVLFTIYTLIIGLFFWSAMTWILKITMEFSYHRVWFERFGVKHKLFLGALVSIIYPFYVLTIGILATLKSKYSWKGRNLPKSVRP